MTTTHCEREACKAPFTPKKWAHPHQRFCSRSCAGLSRADIDDAKVVDLYVVEGLSMAETARRYGCAQATVVAALKRSGHKTRPTAQSHRQGRRPLHRSRTGRKVIDGLVKVADAGRAILREFDEHGTAPFTVAQAEALRAALVEADHVLLRGTSFPGEAAP